MLKILFVAITLLTASTHLLGATTSTNKANPASTPSITIEEIKTREIAALREQNSVMREYHGSILDTVYWALGGIIATVLLLAGFGWWSNFKVYEQDKARLKEELQSLIRGIESTLALKVEENRSQLERTVDTKNENHLNRILEEASTLRTLIDTERSARENKITEISKTLEEAKTQIKKGEKDVAEVEFKLREAEENIWDIKKIPQNVVITQAQGLLAAINAENDSSIKNVLGRMKDTLQKDIVEKNMMLSKITMEFAGNALKKVPGTHAVLTSEVQQILSNTKVANA
jgi:DNA repair exonuclease SbcCD ATPase subunit